MFTDFVGNTTHYNRDRCVSISDVLDMYFITPYELYTAMVDKLDPVKHSVLHEKLTKTLVHIDVCKNIFIDVFEYDSVTKKGDFYVCMFSLMNRIYSGMESIECIDITELFGSHKKTDNVAFGV